MKRMLYKRIFTHLTSSTSLKVNKHNYILIYIYNKYVYIFGASSIWFQMTEVAPTVSAVTTHSVLFSSQILSGLFDLHIHVL